MMDGHPATVLETSSPVMCLAKSLAVGARLHIRRFEGYWASGQSTRIRPDSSACHRQKRSSSNPTRISDADWSRLGTRIDLALSCKLLFGQCTTQQRGRTVRSRQLSAP